MVKTVECKGTSDVTQLVISVLDSQAKGVTFVSVHDADSADSGKPLIVAQLLPSQAFAAAKALLESCGKGWMLRTANHARDYARDTGECVLCTIGGDDAPNKASHENFCPLRRTP